MALRWQWSVKKCNPIPASAIAIIKYWTSGRSGFRPGYYYHHWCYLFHVSSSQYIKLLIFKNRHHDGAICQRLNKYGKEKNFSSYGNPFWPLNSQLDLSFVSRIQASYPESGSFVSKIKALLSESGSCISKLLFQFEFEVSFSELKLRFRNRSANASSLKCLNKLWKEHLFRKRGFNSRNETPIFETKLRI